MFKILIASHGEMAKGIVDTLDILIGPKKQIESVCAYTEAHSLVDALAAYFKQNEDNDVVVLVDLYGGSVQQAFMKTLDQRPKTYLIAGFNLILVLELAMLSESHMLEEVNFAQLIIDSQKGMRMIKRKDTHQEKAFFND